MRGFDRVAYAIAVAGVALLLTAPACAQAAEKQAPAATQKTLQSIEKPALADGDSWTFRTTNESGTNWRQTHDQWSIVHTGSAGNLISIQEVGSRNPPREFLAPGDWSRERSVNGKQTVVNRPFDFPLFGGKTWTVDFTEDNPPDNRQAKRVHWHVTYTVVGWEKVAVPAGTFDVVKVEGNGEWTAEVAPADAAVAGGRKDDQGTTTVVQHRTVVEHTVRGRVYRAFWYAPEIKIFAKVIEEYFNSGGIRTQRLTQELESSKLDG